MTDNKTAIRPKVYPKGSEERAFQCLLQGPAREAAECPLKSLDVFKKNGWVDVVEQAPRVYAGKTWHERIITLNAKGRDEAARRGVTP